jgi:hypothetical protein
MCEKACFEFIRAEKEAAAVIKPGDKDFGEFDFASCLNISHLANSSGASWGNHDQAVLGTDC